MGKEYINIAEISSLRSYSKRLLLFDDFLYSNYRIVDGTGVGFGATRETTYPMTSGQDLVINSRVAGAAIDDECQVDFPAIATPESIITCFVDFLFPAAFGAELSSFVYGAFWKGYTIIAGFRYDRANLVWQYYDSAGSWTNVSATTMQFTTLNYSRLQFSVNLDTHKYLLASVDDEEYSVQDLYCYKTLAGANQSSYFTILIKAVTAVRQIIVIGKVGVWNGLL